MSSNTRTRYTAEYQYPGSFFPETVTKVLNDPTFEAAVEAGPDEEGYFRKDGWYGVIIRTITEKAYEQVGGDGKSEDDYVWLRDGEPTGKSYIVGTEVHADDLADEDEAGNDLTILKSNIRGNSREPKKDIGVITRCGNWQIASDWDEVIPL